MPDRPFDSQFDPSVYFRLGERERDAVLTVEEAYRLARDAKMDWMRRAIDWERVYNVWMPPPRTLEFQKRARVASSKGFATVEHATAKMKAVLFPQNINNPIIRAFPTEPRDLKRSNQVEKLINYQMRAAKIRYKGAQWLRNFNLYGVCPVYPYWRKEIRQRMLRMPIDQQMPDGSMMRMGLGEPSLQNLLMFNGPDFDVGDLEDFFPDSASRAFQPQFMRHVVRRKYIDYYVLQDIVASNPDEYNQEAFAMIKPTDTPPVRDDYYDMQEVTRYHLYPLDMATSAVKGVVELLEYLTRDRIVTIANRRIPIRDKGNDYWCGEIPCIVAVRLPKTNYPWGKGHIEPIEKQLAHKNALRNARLDTINLNVNPPWLALKGMFNAKSFQNLYPNKVIEVTNLEVVKKIDIPDTTQATYIEEERLDMDIEEASSITQLSKGFSQPSVRSAGQQYGSVELATERIQMDVDDFAETGLKPLAEWFYYLDQQHMTEDTAIRVLKDGTPDWEWMKPEDLQGEYDWTVESTIRATPVAVEAQQQTQAMQLAAPYLQQFPDKALKLLKVLYQKQGYNDLAQTVGEMVEEIEGVRRNQPGGVMGGAGGPEGQGARGNEGNGTAPENMPEPTQEGVVEGTSNRLATPDLVS